MAVQTYPEAQLARQPIGYWSGVVHRDVVGFIRGTLAKEQLTQPQWWTLNHVGDAPGTWTRQSLAERLSVFGDPGLDFTPAFAGLSSRGWLAETGGTLALTPDGEAGLLRARERVAKANRQLHEGISRDEYLAALDVLRRMVDNVGGNSDLP
ncbi:MarR family winged helix-turn-helix transcriptional regulator [Yinghuangia soli]|uniref:MarR family winged helix-turn-helix transcriptional regulator n=1 Tax=Yinghuangia soli TaxID=2908204 RepID=A0AA41U0X8_9ACTN|nr:MarR family winged helix-turn-helix transcriptional regulator [Yinghuangia soli]MCF2528945.1 MarR family winged helix-turn-helix transcriptional regulator [Yinghuangia soli]